MAYSDEWDICRKWKLGCLIATSMGETFSFRVATQNSFLLFWHVMIGYQGNPTLAPNYKFTNCLKKMTGPLGFVRLSNKPRWLN